MRAATSKVLPNCTTVGVPKALMESTVAGLRMVAMSVITTNWIPMSAAADVPTIW
jgi:hypothetical protein